MQHLVDHRITLEPLTQMHAREMFTVLSDPAIYEFENAPPASEAWLLARYARLESRGPIGGSETWLNWVIRLANGELAGYVQATVTKQMKWCWPKLRLPFRMWPKPSVTWTLADT